LASNGSTTDSVVLRLQTEQSDIASLNDAYAKMQQISPTDNRSWIYWAGFHGFPNYYCWHHGRAGADGSRFPYNLFLPWHRAYLLYWENAARDQNPNAVLPWWDWTAQTGVPAAFSEPQLPDGSPNALFSGPLPDMPDSPARPTRRWPGDPAQLPSPEQIDSLLGLTSYEDFQTQIEDVHDFIHGWMGGVNPDDNSQGGDVGMIATAAFDPLFWAHHCTIDRVWYLWQLRQGITNIPPAQLGLVLTPFRYTVRDVLDIRQLGYEYATSVTVP
jgi:tyrosinase